MQASLLLSERQLSHACATVSSRSAAHTLHPSAFRHRLSSSASRHRSAVICLASADVQDSEVLSQDAVISALLALSDHVPSKPAKVAKKRAAVKQQDQRVAEVKKRGRGRPRKTPNPEFATATAALREASLPEATAEASNREIQPADLTLTEAADTKPKQSSTSANAAAAKARLSEVQAGTADGLAIRTALLQAGAEKNQEQQVEQARRLTMLHIAQQLTAKLETALETMQEQTKDMDDEAAEKHLRLLLSEGGGLLERARNAAKHLAASVSTAAC